MENKKNQQTKLALEQLIRGVRTPNATHSTKNSEVEGDEYGKDTMGNVSKFIGEKHEDGGMPMQLEDGEKILSDNNKPSKTYRKMLEEKYKVKIMPKDTYSSVLDKINSKIGFKKIEDEQLKIADKIVKNDKVKDENTKMLNEQAYQKKLGDLEKIKEFKSVKKEEAFDDLYDMQETSKQVENGKYIDEESGVEVMFENGGMMFKKSHLPLLTKVKLANGYRTQDEINNHFSNKLKNGGMKKVNYYLGGGEQNIENIATLFKNPIIIATLKQTSPALLAKMELAASGLKENNFTEEEFNYISELSDYHKNNSTPLGRNSKTNNRQVIPNVQNVAKNGAVDRKNEKLLDKSAFLQKWSNQLRANKYGQIEHPLQHITTKGEANLYNLTTQEYQDRISEYYQLFPELASKHFPITKGKDGKDQYKKLSNTETKAFQEDYDKYARQAIKKYGLNTDEESEVLNNISFLPNLKEGESARLYDGKMGVFTSSRSGFKSPILPKAKIDALNKAGIYHISTAVKDPSKLYELGLSVSEVSKLKEEKAKFGDYYMLPTDVQTPVATNVIAEGNPPVINTTNTTEAKDEIPLPQRLNNPRHLMSVQHTPPPTSLKMPALVNPQMRDQTFVKISPEQAIRENQRGLNYMGEQLRETESGTQGAAFANIAGKMFEANNEAIAAANIWNANQRVNYDNEMSRRFDIFDNMRMNQIAAYTNNVNEAVQNTENDWRTYFMDRDILERQAQKDASIMNMYESITPNQNLDPRTGEITYTKPTFGQWIKKTKN